MRFVEAVTGKLLDDVEDLLRRFFVDISLRTPFDELRALLLHDVRLLLAHGAPEKVGLAEGVPGEYGGALHHLLLVEDDAVGLAQHAFEQRMEILHRSASVLALNILVHHSAAEGAGTVHGEHGDKVLETVHLELLEQLAHSGRFKLEDSQSVGLLQHFVGLPVVERDALHVGERLPPQRDVLQRLFDDGERPESEEVHLDEAELLDGLHRILRDNLVLADAANGDEIGNRDGGDHHSGRVLRTVAGKPFDVGGDVEHARHHRVALFQLGKLGNLLDGLADGVDSHRGNEPRDGDDVAHGHAEHPADVGHRRPALETSERDDLRYLVVPVLLGDVMKQFVAPLVGDVRIDIGHADTLGVEEALKEQVILDRVELGNLEAPGHKRARGGASSRTYRNLSLLRGLDDARDDQEVAREPHRIDHADLKIETLSVLLGYRIADALAQADDRLFFEVRLERFSLGKIEARELVVAFSQGKGHVAALRDGDRVVERVGELRAEDGVHLLWRPEVEVVA